MIVGFTLNALYLFIRDLLFTSGAFSIGIVYLILLHGGRDAGGGVQGECGGEHTGCNHHAVRSTENSLERRCPGGYIFTPFFNPI